MTFTEAIIERINELCKLNHITTNKLSELSTVPATTLYALLYDKVENPSSKNIYKFCNKNIGIVYMYTIMYAIGYFPFGDTN